MARSRATFSIRSFREADEQVLAHLFNEYSAGFFGPFRVTPQSWRGQLQHQGWTGPSVAKDRECVRVAVRGEKILGYAVTDYEPIAISKGALIQELCVAANEDAEEIVDALIADAERRALSRGKTFITLELPVEDGYVEDVCERRGYYPRLAARGVFMATVTDLSALLRDLEEELSLRLRESESRSWRGTIGLESGDQSCRLVVGEGAVTVGAEGDRADMSVSVDPEVLPLLLFGRTSVGELYAEDRVGLEAEDREAAFRLLNALLPHVPLSLPRAQWW